jgi:hypothetical protein
MGACANCWIGAVHVATSKNDVDPGIMNLFRGRDRQVRTYGDSYVPAFVADDYSEPDPAFRFVYYQAPVAAIRDRLELEGYTVGNCRRLFEEWREYAIRQKEEWAERPDLVIEDGELQKIYVANTKKAEEDLNRLRSLTVDHWMIYFREIVQNQVTYKDADKYSESFIGQMLRWSQDGWYGYAGPDNLVAIRLALEALPDEEVLTYDLTDLALQEYLEVDEDPIEALILSTAGDYNSRSRVIILTEGKSDAALLKSALALLYPHLADYFSFMDFSDFGGGAGQLANLVRGFAAAGIVNRVMALFDNDAAAHAAIKTIAQTKLPKHIVVRHLPDLAELRVYPTLGPTGLSEADINGSAASLELYLGREALCGDATVFPPVQWTGYEKSVRKYQAELPCKNEVQERFAVLLGRAASNPVILESQEWDGLRAIFQVIFSAFHELDGEMLSKFHRRILQL